jgi:hypothetical protein
MFACNTSMTDRCFYNSDGDFLIGGRQRNCLLMKLISFSATGRVFAPDDGIRQDARRPVRDRRHSTGNALQHRRRWTDARIYSRSIWHPFHAARPRTHWFASSYLSTCARIFTALHVLQEPMDSPIRVISKRLPPGTKIATSATIALSPSIKAHSSKPLRFVVALLSSVLLGVQR